MDRIIIGERRRGTKNMHRSGLNGIAETNMCQLVSRLCSPLHRVPHGRGLGSLTRALVLWDPSLSDNKMHDLPFRLLERLATKAQQRQLREECARKRERERDKDNKGGREIYIYPLSLTMTLRKATRVTFERQDDAMNYKMTVKAKVSSGFADTKEKDGREREGGREI